MKFEGEHLLPGQMGHFFVLVAFVSSILATIGFIKASFEKDLVLKNSWLKYARAAFFIQFASILIIFGLIFYICSNHYFEYLYVYKHASKELEPKYLLACIWEGQEGSFLLWAIWHCVLGTILIFKSKQWEPYVLSVISFAQIFLILMILGLYFGGVRIGSSAFVLTRNENNIPLFSLPDYLSRIKDGIGLNVLLRNYWMVIHPPVLFLGFASTIVPISFAYAGLASKKYGEWVKPVIPWALLSSCVLGVGIMMGGKWAYESLSFGGYWAWDPVENAALVPWMIIVAGLHCLVIYNATGNSLRASYLFIILANAFVLYSTFLTRTGILGDSSVHSFTEAGLAMNVLIGIFAIGIPLPVLILYFTSLKKIPAIHKEEDSSSREFWMFIGVLILFLSSLYIIAITSVPVFNKMFNQHIADPPDREFAYNKVLVLVAVIIGILTAMSQYFKYRLTGLQNFLKQISVPAIVAIALTVLIGVVYPITFTKKGLGFLGAIYLALFACIFSFLANLSYIRTVLKGNLKAAGSAIAHAGFALMICGMLISSGNREVITDNRKTGLFVPFDKDPTGRNAEDPLENLTLVKNVPTVMAQYSIMYTGDSAAKEKNRTFINLSVEKKDTTTGKVSERFELRPDVYKMKDNNLSSNPDIKHYLFHDVFTYISSLSVRNEDEDTSKFNIHEMNIGDTAYYSKGFVVLNNLLKNPDNERFHFSPRDTALVAEVTVFTKAGTSYKAYPLLSIHNFEVEYKDDTVFSQNLFVRLSGMTTRNKFRIAVRESEVPAAYVTIKAYVFPFINLVWIGLILMAGGFITSIIRRTKASPLVGAITLILVLSGLFYMFLIASN